MKTDSLLPLSSDSKAWDDLIYANDLNDLQLKIESNPALINVLDEEGYAPLHLAVKQQRISHVHALIKAGADINLLSQSGCSALEYAAAKKHPGIIKTLLSYGAKNPFAGLPWNDRALSQFDDMDNYTFWALTEKKTYGFNPHRHVKIWLSPDREVFMNARNQLRLVRMRLACPNDEINLVYDSLLLSAQAHQDALKFCAQHHLNPVDVRTILSQCTQNREHILSRLYEEELSHLNEGGNLAAASDMLRWLGPVYRLGTYSDLDVRVSTKKLPATITVFEEILVNVGSVKDAYLSCNNDVIAVVNPHSNQIKKAQQFIINAYRAFRASQDVGDLSQPWVGAWSNYDDHRIKLQAMYHGQTPRQWRKAIPAFIHCLGVLHEEMAKDKNVIANGYPSVDISKLFSEWEQDSTKLEQRLYMRSVIASTGPSVVDALFPQRYLDRGKIIDYVVSAYSLAFYKPLHHAFSSSQRVFLHMSESARQAVKGGDASWIRTGRFRMAKYDAVLHKKAGTIQNAWRRHLAIEDYRFLRFKAFIERDSRQIHGVDKYRKSLLLYAASQGAHRSVAYLIAQGADINRAFHPLADYPYQEENNTTALDGAIRGGHVATLELLLKAGARANHLPSTIKGKTLSVLIKDNDLRRVQMLLTLNNTLLNLLGSYGYPPLHLAIRLHHLKIAEYLISAGADLNSLIEAVSHYNNIPVYHKTALDLAMICKNDFLSLRLIEAGAKNASVVPGEDHAIHLVAQYGRLDLVQALMAQNPELLDLPDEYNQTPLLLAASRGHHELVAFFIAQHAALNIATELPEDHPNQEEHNCTALDWAIRTQHTQAMLLLRAAGAKANHSHSKIKNKSLLQTIEEVDVHGVQHFIQFNRALLNAVDERGFTPQHSIEEVDIFGEEDFIIFGGELLNTGDEQGFTPLQCAAFFGHAEIVRCLIDEGADLNTRVAHKTNKYVDLNAMDIALRKNHDSVVILLLATNATITPAVEGVSHALHVAARHGLLNQVIALVEQEPGCVNALDDDFKTPLAWAASNGHHKIVAFLISQGADVNLAPYSKKPLDRALFGNHRDTILILMNAGAAVNREHTMLNNKSLKDFISDKDAVGIQILITCNKALLNQLDSDGYAPLHYAALGGHADIVHTLIGLGADVNCATAPVLSGQYDSIRHHQMTARELWLIDHSPNNNPFNCYYRAQDLQQRITEINRLITTRTPSIMAQWHAPWPEEKSRLLQLKQKINQAVFISTDSPDKTADDLLTEITSAWAEEWQQESPPKRTRKQTFFSADTSAPKPTEQVLQAIKALLRPNMNTIPTESVSSAIDDLLSLPELSKP